MQYNQKNSMKNNIFSSIGFFCLGVAVTSAVITFYRTPQADWAPYIEDRNMFWSAQADDTSQQGRQNLWNSMIAQNTELWDEVQRMNTAIEEMERPDSMYNAMMVQRAVEVFARNAVADYMYWEEEVFWDQIDSHTSTESTPAIQEESRLDLPENEND
jgi:hypothetical protein